MFTLIGFVLLFSRRSNYQRCIRPASFPGPVPAVPTASVAPSTLLKPPRSLSTSGGACSAEGDHPGAGSVVGESNITLDAYAYRQLLQDTTATKTMLLKLKRMLQDVSDVNESVVETLF